jgi:hypothetical protein
MIVKVDSWLYRLLFALPIWLPYSIEHTRVGYDSFSYVRITWRKPK